MTDGYSSPRLEDFKDDISEQLTTLQAAAREFFDKQREANQRAPRAMRIELRTSLDDPESPRPVGGISGVECYTHTYVGGHLADGTPYYVIETVCIEGVLGIGET
jgi:hypothetical protein